MHQNLGAFQLWLLSFELRGVYHVELPSEERSSAVLGFALVRSVALEELPFGLKRNTDLLVGFDVSLTSVYHRNVTQSQRNNAPG
jgi:hypothetical protein